LQEIDELNIPILSFEGKNPPLSSPLVTTCCPRR
jgi:hypothetical protein